MVCAASSWQRASSVQLSLHLPTQVTLDAGVAALRNSCNACSTTNVEKNNELRFLTDFAWFGSGDSS